MPQSFKIWFLTPFFAIDLPYGPGDSQGKEEKREQREQERHERELATLDRERLWTMTLVSDSADNELGMIRESTGESIGGNPLGGIHWERKGRYIRYFWRGPEKQGKQGV